MTSLLLTYGAFSAATPLPCPVNGRWLRKRLGYQPIGLLLID
jgi:hypothetical protein